MKTLFLAIGFTFVGVFTPLAKAQIIPLTFDPTQSSADVTIAGNLSSSQLSGTATLDIQNLNPPSGSAQITQLDITADEGLSYSFFLGFVSASTSPGDVTISITNPGAPGSLSGTSFDQLANVIAIDGDLTISDPLGFAGGNQTLDLSTIAIAPFDIASINVTQSGNTITVSNSFTFTESLELGELELAVTYVATGVVPVVLSGDVNLDGVVDFFDIAPFIELLNNQSFQTEADIDMNQVVDFFDITPFIEILVAS